jgi:hypothetical protein
MLVPKGVLAALAAAFVLVTTAAPSLALTEHSRDAARDVLSAPLASEGPPTRHERDRRVGDIMRNTASYGTDLVVTTKFRNLDAVGFQEYSWLLLTSIDPYESWQASFLTRPGRSSGQVALYDPIANSPDCATVALDRAARTITLTIPAACLGNPDWVKVGNGVFFHNRTRLYEDDARRDGAVTDEGWKYSPKLTPQ